jgi:hypothetical protein
VFTIEEVVGENKSKKKKKKKHQTFKIKPLHSYPAHDDKEALATRKGRNDPDDEKDSHYNPGVWKGVWKTAIDFVIQDDIAKAGAFIAVNVPFVKKDGGIRSKLILVMYSDDKKTPTKRKMLCTSTLASLKGFLGGCDASFSSVAECHSAAELEMSSINGDGKIPECPDNYFA